MSDDLPVPFLALEWAGRQIEAYASTGLDIETLGSEIVYLLSVATTLFGLRLALARMGLRHGLSVTVDEGRGASGPIRILIQRA